MKAPNCVQFERHDNCMQMSPTASQSTAAGESRVSMEHNEPVCSYLSLVRLLSLWLETEKETLAALRALRQTTRAEQEHFRSALAAKPTRQRTLARSLVRPASVPCLPGLPEPRRRRLGSGASRRATSGRRNRTECSQVVIQIRIRTARAAVRNRVEQNRSPSPNSN